MSKGAIAGSHFKTIESAEEILKAGGNAFDAAISACFTMFATEPCMVSAGAGGFAMVHSAKTGTRVLDFFTQTPQKKNLQRELDFQPLPVDFGTEVETFYIGKASIAVPGVVAGIFELHKQYGSMPIKELVVHAKEVSKRGVVIDPFGEIDMELLQEILRVDPAVRDIFFSNDKIKKQGDTLVYPHLADFLDFLVDEGDRGFYEGEIAQKISKSIYEGGGFLTLDDFEAYKTYWSEPMRMPYRNKMLCLPNGPCFGGAILALLDYYGSKDLPLVLVLKKVKEIYEQKKLEDELHTILPELNYQTQGFGMASKGTTHISIVDKHGNASALTMSLGEGSGYWIPGTDMQMNNMMGETFLLPHGHHSWQANQRLNSMMTPVMVLNDNDKINYVGGSGGAGRIPYVIFQVLEAVFGKEMSLEDATHYARMHWHDGVLQFEEGAELKGFDLKEKHRTWKKGSLFFGGVHSILRDRNNELFAVGDSRRFGQGKVLH